MNRFINNKKYILIGLILVIAFFLRIFNVVYDPPSLNWDEVSIGYNAFSVLKTSKDEWGKVFPTIFRAYGDYKLPLYVYLTVPSISLFGLNTFSVRLVSVVAGTISVLFTYLLVKELLSLEKARGMRKSDDKTEAVATLSALLVTLEPWSLFLSRPAFEANLALCFFNVGFYFFLKSIRRLQNIVPSIIFFGLTLWTYNSYRIFTPLFVVFLFLIFRNELKAFVNNRKYLMQGSILTLLFLLPLIYQFAAGVGVMRYSKVAIIDEGAIGQIINLRDKYNFSPLVERAVFNRPTYFTYNFLKNIFSHFSYKFLFVQGGTNYQFNDPNFGLLYKIDLIFLISGVIFLIKSKDKKTALLLGWLILGTVPSSLMREAPHGLISITMLPAPMIISAFGFVGVFSLIVSLSSKVKSFNTGIICTFFVVLYLLILAKQLLNYQVNYFNSYKSTYSWSWQYGYQEVIQYVAENYNKYDKIIVTKKYGEPHEFFLFYLKWNPLLYQADKNLIRFEQSNWFWVDRFDKFFFVNDWEVPSEEWQPFVLESKKEEIDCREIKCLLITSPGNVPKTWNKLESVQFLDGSGAFEIYDN